MPLRAAASRISYVNGASAVLNASGMVISAATEPNTQARKILPKAALSPPAATNRVDRSPGGTDATAIHDVAYAAWPNKPSDASITVTQSCTCFGAAASCTTLCSDNLTYPQAFTSIAASGTYTGVFSSQSMSSTAPASVIS